MNSDENELDFDKLISRLWQGKLWIISCMILFIAGAQIYIFFAKQEWVSQAIVTKPNTDLLGDYYIQQQLLNSLSSSLETTTDFGGDKSVSAEVFNEFIQQITAYNNRRQFWLQSEYYKANRSGTSYEDKEALEELTESIKLVNFDEKNKEMTVQLTMATAADAKKYLDKYIAYIEKITIASLNKELMVKQKSLFSYGKNCADEQKTVAEQLYQRKVELLKNRISSLSQVEDKSVNFIDQQESLKMLELAGPEYSSLYYQCMGIVKSLQTLTEPIDNYKPFRYLRSPEEPLKRSKPRQSFLFILWGCVGILCGSVISLIRARNL